MNPDYDKNGLPLHVDECPEYDGKRCKLMGFRPDRFCEPALIDARTQMLAAYERVVNLLSSWESDRGRGSAAWDDTMGPIVEELRRVLKGDA